jgi:glutathione S-transferase
MSLKIHAFPLSPRSFKPLWLANHVGVDYEFTLVDFTKNAQNAPEYLALNPNGRAPVLDHDGYILWESNAICEYLALLKPESKLLPQDTRARLQVEKWLFWESAHWDSTCAIFAFERVVKTLFQRGDADPAEIAKGEAQFARVGAVLDGVLAKSRYVAGDSLTVADFAIGSAMVIAEQAKFPIEPFRSIQRWKADLKSLPSWAKTEALRVPPPGMAA